MTSASQLKEHMDVIASDGQKIGNVDHLDGKDKLQLTKVLPTGNTTSFLWDGSTMSTSTSISIRRRRMGRRSGARPRNSGRIRKYWRWKDKLCVLIRRINNPLRRARR